MGKDVLCAALSCKCCVGGQEISAEHADEYGGGERDNDPDCSYTAGSFKLRALTDSHETQEHLGHAEVSEAPRSGRKYGKEAVFRAFAEERGAVKRLLHSVGVGHGVRNCGQ